MDQQYIRTIRFHAKYIVYHIARFGWQIWRTRLAYISLHLISFYCEWRRI